MAKKAKRKGKKGLLHKLTPKDFDSQGNFVDSKSGKKYAVFTRTTGRSARFFWGKGVGKKA